MKPIHIWPEDIKIAGEQVTHCARIEDCEPFTLYFRVPIGCADLLSQRAESFVAGVLLLAMMRGADLRVHAPLSPSFLRNLEEFQAIWACWDSNFRRISIESDGESESSSSKPRRAISMFSGGVDSCYTVWRHTRNRCGRRALPLHTALLVNGVDSDYAKGPAYDAVFENVFVRSRKMLQKIDVNLMPLTTNFRSVIPLPYAKQAFGSALASCLLLFQESYSHGLIPASFSYHGLVLPYGSTPLTDPLFSTARFAIEHDGANFSRAEKMSEIVQWPRFLEQLRVCNQYGHALHNCGRCEKCVRNILTLRIIGIQDPPSFPNKLTNQQIGQLHLRGTDLEAMRRVLQAARAAKVEDSWVISLEKTLRREQIYARWDPTRERIKSRIPERLRLGLRAIKARRPN